MFTQALHYYQKHEFNKIIAIDSDDSRVLELKGIAALKLEQFELALSVFKTLLNKNDNAQNNYHAGLASLNLQNYTTAISFFNKAIADRKFRQASQINSAVCLFELKQNSKAIVLLTELVKSQEACHEAWYLLLKHFRQTLNIEQLKIYCQHSQNNIQNTVEWQKSYALVLLHEKKYQDICDSYLKSPFYQDIFIKSIVAKSHSKLSKFEQAVAIYKEILQDEKNALNYYNVGAAYSHLTDEKDLQQAIKYAQKCLEENPSYHMAHHTMALSWQKLNNNTQALKCINNALALDATNQSYLYDKAEILKNLQQPQQALKILQKLLALDKYHHTALRLKGIIKLQLHKNKSAEKNLKKAIKLDTTDQRAIAYYAISKLAQNKIEEVEELMALGHFVKEFRFNPQPDYASLEAFNRDFENDIKKHSQLRKEPYGLAARNGYLTADLFADNTKSIQVFKKLLAQKIENYINQLPQDSTHHMLRHKTHNYSINSWATWVHGDGFIDKHIHEESWISGAYYCKVPTITQNAQQHEGYFEYGCIPHDITITSTKKRGYIQPVEGKLVIFPSYLYHQTIPHITDDDRISVAFDLTPTSWLK